MYPIFFKNYKGEARRDLLFSAWVPDGLTFGFALLSGDEKDKIRPLLDYQSTFTHCFASLRSVVNNDVFSMSRFLIEGVVVIVSLPPSNKTPSNPLVVSITYHKS